jgi:hypothetical protein
VSDPVREAIRFAEEYGYREWVSAQDVYTELLEVLGLFMDTSARLRTAYPDYVGDRPDDPAYYRAHALFARITKEDNE